ncbi:MAG: Gfo/Idh/MocA family oxidoreductase [Candidatus Latescibacteria bacterium]|nr:Gfo/Idh/MocA family oxidoreductase [Candidatus Latescibacterota bacterium]
MKPIRLGVVGCGAIAQVQHLPNLAEMQEEFEVAMVCDQSAQLARAVARRFHLPRHTSDYRRLLEADLDAVLLCHSDPKTEIAVAAFEAGKHVFIEKPVCFSLEDADAMIGAAQMAGKVAQAGYMKVYDPAFERAKREVDNLKEIRFAQVNHLHTDNSHHLKQFRLLRFDDIPAEAGAALQAARQVSLRQALGQVSPQAERAFFILAGSMIHDLYGLRLMLGVPVRVVSAEVWNEGWAINALIEYPGGVRCAATWVELPKLWEFRETLEIYDEAVRLVLSYPTGFSRGQLSSLAIHHNDTQGVPMRGEPAIDWENPFSRELRHFHQCLTQGIACRTSLAEARHDVELVIQIVKRYLERT